MTLAIYACRKPVIAAINGAAVGIGATMTLAMDARLMSTKARFGLVFARLGITPEAASTWFLPRLVGMATALDLMYSAEILDGDVPLEVGLASAVHEPDELLAAACAVADRWTRGRSAVAVAMTRQMVYRNAAAAHPVDAAPGRLAVDAVHEHRRRRRGRRRVPRQARRGFTASASTDLPPFYDEHGPGSSLYARRGRVVVGRVRPARRQRCRARPQAASWKISPSVRRWPVWRVLTP